MADQVVADQMVADQVYELRNGAVLERLPLRREQVLDELRPRAVTADLPVSALAGTSLDAPVGSPPLEVLAARARDAVIVCDDLTRPTPVRDLLPAVVERLTRGGLRDQDITVLIATGTHRPMTPAELDDRLGRSMTRRLRVVNHDYTDRAGLVDRGSTASGVPIQVNRLAADADLLVGIGNIVPHRYCGWAGGAKIIQPGICGEPTTAATHLMITRDPGARLGVVENTVRQEIELVADGVGLDFIVNTVLDDQAHALHVVSGDFRAAFRDGVRLAREVFGAGYRTAADVVVASAYPSDLNLWQAGKALYAADLVVRDAGLVILASPCPEGIGEHGSFSDLIALPPQDIERQIADGAVDDRISAAAALAVSLVRRRADIWLASTGFTADQADRMGMRLFATAADAVRTAVAERPDARFSLLHNAAELLPVHDPDLRGPAR